MDLATVVELYRKYANDLAAVRDAQRQLLTTFTGKVKAQLDDIEAEITYLRVRDARPRTVVEIGALHGWSATWILRALKDNGAGHLHSYDLIDSSERHVPDDLARNRTFHHGDVREKWRDLDPDYVFIDAAHSARFAHWYVKNLFPALKSGTPVSVHDVYHFRWPIPFSEGAVLMRHLAERGIASFTAAKPRRDGAYERLMDLRRDLGLAEPIRDSTDNPMVYFTLP
ncbi:class I SAM-dependent methyltransferase [Fodinicola acaciae]|uniref:class I SAM-dependent methyltransferase n=1 Tax=Fodinicola acaciae TaxID=2681555 RepID=UPI001C9E32E3|nr:class I SAM-dependent methyltransferase [Fodinicola acaciae]